jgi:hypothetical protein
MLSTSKHIVNGLLDSFSQTGQWWVIVGNSGSHGLIGDV